MDFSVQNSIKWALYLLEGRFLHKHVGLLSSELSSLLHSRRPGNIAAL